MLRIIFLTIFLVTVTFSNFVEAADKPKVLVMDLGTFDGAFTNELNTERVGMMVSRPMVLLGLRTTTVS